jgi:hypothetical protein
MHFVIMHLWTDTDLSAENSRHPGHLFFSLRYARQVPQFIPQGAISAFLNINELLIAYSFYHNNSSLN